MRLRVGAPRRHAPRFAGSRRLGLERTGGAPMTTRQTSPGTVVAGIASAPVAAPTKRADLKPTNSIMSAVATAWDLDVRRRAAKIGVKDAGREERQTIANPHVSVIFS